MPVSWRVAGFQSSIAIVLAAAFNFSEQKGCRVYFERALSLTKWVSLVWCYADIIFYFCLECSSLAPIPGCILSVYVEPHPTLARAIHLLPPSTLISLDDVIPGLVPTDLLEGT